MSVNSLCHGDTESLVLPRDAALSGSLSGRQFSVRRTLSQLIAESLRGRCKKNDDVPRGSPESLPVFLRSAGTWTTQNRVQPPGLPPWDDNIAMLERQRKPQVVARESQAPKTPKSPRLLASRKRPQGFRQIGKSWSGLERHAKPLLGEDRHFWRLRVSNNRVGSGERQPRGGKWMARGGFRFVIANQFPSDRGLHALPWPCLGLRILPTHAGMRRPESRARRVEETHLPCDILIFKLKSRAMGGLRSAAGAAAYLRHQHTWLSLSHRSVSGFLTLTPRTVEMPCTP